MDRYSGKAVSRAGDALLCPSILEDDRASDFTAAMDVLSWWRLSHEKPLELAFRKLQLVSKKYEKNSIYGKRLKRFPSIVLKLKRFEKQGMKLRTMQDVGGCRVVVGSQKRLYKILRELKLNPEFMHSDGRYRIKDYIKNPKDDGYRGVHLIGQFEGLYGNRSIELQLRTRTQHAWATSVEIIDTFTGQALKSNQGQQVWSDFFSKISFLMAEMDRLHSFDNLDVSKKAKRFSEYVKEQGQRKFAILYKCAEIYRIDAHLHVRKKFSAFSGSLKVLQSEEELADISKYVLVEVNMRELVVSTTEFSRDDAEGAERQFTELERKFSNSPNYVVALVSSSAIGGIKEAYPNFFADSGRFLDCLDVILHLGRSYILHMQYPDPRFS